MTLVTHRWEAAMPADDHGQIYTDLIMAFTKGHFGDCDPCARWALHEFIRLTVIAYVANGNSYAPVRNYLRRQFRSIGQRVAWESKFQTATHEHMQRAINDQVNETRRKLQAVSMESLGRVCENHTEDTLDDCPAAVMEAQREEELRT